MGVTTNYDNILNTCNLQTNDRWIQQCYQNGSYEADVTGKVVFICGSANIRVPLLTAIVIIPSLKEFLSFSPHHDAKKDEVCAWISLDGGSEYAEALELLLVKMLQQDEVILSFEMIDKIRDLIKMIGIKENTFKLKNYGDKFVNYVENTDWMMHKESQWQMKPSSPSTIDPAETNSVPITLNEEMNLNVDKDINKVVDADGPLLPKKSGNKRKNINDAIESINARKKMKEEIEIDNFPLSTEEQVVGDGDPVHKSPTATNDGRIEGMNFYELHSNTTPVGDVENDQSKRFIPDPEKEEFQVKEELLETDSLQCPVFDCKTTTAFRARYEFLMHLTTAHYLDKFLSSFPFGKESKCMICVEKRAKQRTPKTKSAWITHVLTHEEAWEVFPAEIVEMVKKLPKRVRAQVKKASVAIEDDEKVPVEGLTNIDADVAVNQDDGNTSYIEPHFDVAEEATTATSEADSTLAMDQTEYSEEDSHDATKELPDVVDPGVNDPDATLVKMDLQKIDSLPVTDEFFPQPIAQSTATIDTKQLDNFLGTGKQLIQEPNPNIEVKQEAECFEQTAVLPEKEFERPNDDSQEGHVCKYCTSRSFPERKKLLVHLSLVHFQRQILDKFPFKENESCPLCDQIINTKSVYLLHIGEGHEQVISIMDEEEGSNWPEEATANEKEVTGTMQDAPKNVVNPAVSASEEVTEMPQDTKSGVITCSLCVTVSRKFDKRGDFLKHLSLTHFGRAILQNYPFNPDENCQFCWEESGKEYKPSKKEVHVCHVGILHHKLNAMITPDIEKQIQKLSHKKTDSPLMPCKYCDLSIPRKEMKEHLISHKTMLQEGNYDEKQ